MTDPGDSSAAAVSGATVRDNGAARDNGATLDRAAARDNGAAPLSAEAALLCEALELDESQLHEFSREPLGDGTVAGFQVHDGAHTVTAYVDTSGIAVAAETGLAQEGVGRIWTHPADPHLPALAAAAFGSAVQTLLSRLGVADVGEPEMVAYRPGRRAVLRVSSAEGVLWIKMVRPRHVERIVAAHRALRDAGVAAPQIRAWSPTGLLVIAEANGTPATSAVWTAEGLIDAVERVRVAIAATTTEHRARSAALSRVDWYAARVISLNPALAERVSALQTALLATPSSGEATIHGDLHFGQLFLNDAGDDITGVIDVDTLGVGDVAEDPAAFLSHAIASWALAVEASAGASGVGVGAASSGVSAAVATDAATDGGAGSPAVRRLAELVAAASARWGSDPAVRGRAAAQLLGHATSALESGHAERAHRLLAQAEQWADAPAKFEK